MVLGCVLVCVCVCERERERERESGGGVEIQFCALEGVHLNLFRMKVLAHSIPQLKKRESELIQHKSSRSSKKLKSIVE